ncbi:MAG: class I SAM-dependent methyltransferase [Methanoregula sp.]
MRLDISPAGNYGPESPSRMAEGIALQRFAESMLPEDMRIFYDPYAVYFLNPALLAWGKTHPAEAKAMADEIEEAMPGWSNTIRARVRFFDEICENAPGEGFNQLVILGAGYDTRAYRIGTLKDRVRIFEIDRAETQARKTAILERVLGEPMSHVSFIPIDLGHEHCWQALEGAGWSPDQKTLFLLEGLVMYLPRPVVADLFSGLCQNAGAGSAVLFDFIPQSMADGSSEAEGGRKIRAYTILAGEPLQSGFEKDEIVPFLASHGFTGIQVIPSRDFGRMYYSGKNADRKISGLMTLAYATIPGPEQATGGDE